MDEKTKTLVMKAIDAALPLPDVTEDGKDETSPNWCRVCGEPTKMIDSRDAMTEHWECIACKTINIFAIADKPYRGGVPKNLVFESIL